MKKLSDIKLAVIGLGYVGLPLAAEFGKSRETTAFDIDSERISELLQGKDSTLEVNEKDLSESKNLKFTNSLKDISKCNCFIITVPTPIDKNNKPNLYPLIQASKSVGNLLKKEDVVIYESTVYPGATEEECVPILEHASGLKLNEDFYLGYSPERINPGDKEHSITQVMKVTSGSTPEAAKLVNNLYKEIILAGTHMAPSIRVAEAAKVIENTQRDLNIALINELAIIFNRLEIDTEEVLKAAATKWNFLPFRPGLVGGHCIGVDPYYLTFKAEATGYNPEIILSGRKVNDSMGSYVAAKLLKEMEAKRMISEESSPRVLIMGLAFKENCPDSRNNRTVDIMHDLFSRNCLVDIYDPWVSKKEALKEFNITLLDKPSKETYDAIILAVAHREFKLMGIEKIHSLGKENHILFDLKYVFSSDDSDLRL